MTQIVALLVMRKSSNAATRHLDTKKSLVQLTMTDITEKLALLHFFCINLVPTYRHIWHRLQAYSNSKSKIDPLTEGVLLVPDY